MFTHIFPRRSSHDRLCRAVLTLLHPHWLCSVSEDPSHSGGRLSSIPRAPCLLHAPLSSTAPPAIRKFSLQCKVDCIISCSQLSGAPAASMTKPGTLECYLRPRGLGPALLSSLGVSAPSFLCCSPDGLGPQTQSSTRTLEGSVSISLSVSPFLSLSLALVTLRGAFSAFPFDK